MSLTVLMWITIALAVLVLALIVALGLLWQRQRALRHELTTFFGDGAPTDLEHILQAHSTRIEEFDDDIQKLFDASNKLHVLGNKSLHRIGVIRFNPFQDLGGNHSFSIALLDGKDNGVVISSLHTREGTRVYAKDVQKGTPGPQQAFTDEEEQAIAAAA